MIPSPASPILLDLGFFQLRWYSITMLIAVLTALFWAVRRGKKQGFHEDHIFNMSFYMIIFGFIGARLFAVFYDYQYYFQNISQIPQVWKGGLAIHGGVVFGFLALWWYCHKQKIALLQMIDIVIPSLLIGQIIGRLGNYFNQEAYGMPTDLPWGIYIAPQNRYLQYKAFESFHPTFLYEALWNGLVLFIVLRIEKSLKLKAGSLAGIYCICYGIGRGLLEFIRTDATFLGPLRFVHWLSIFLILIGSIMLIKLNQKKSS